MNAVAGLLLDIHRIETENLGQLEPFIDEGRKAAAILRALADAMLERAGAVRKDGAPLFDYPFLQEGGEPEDGPKHEERPLPASSVSYVNLTLSALQVNSLAGSLGEAFAGFAAQTAALSAVYSPLLFPNSAPVPLAAAVPPAISPLHETPHGRPAIPTGRAHTPPVPESLVRSVSVLQKLETIRTGMIESLCFRKPAPGHLPYPGWTLPEAAGPQFPHGGEQLPVPTEKRHSRSVPAPESRYPEPLEALFFPLHRMLLRSEETANLPLPAMVPVGHPPFPSLPPSAPETTGAELPFTDRRSAPAPGSIMPAAGGVTGLPGSRLPEYHRDPEGKPQRRTPGGRHPPAGTSIIEIPSLVPGGVKDLRSGMATANASRFSDGIAWLSGSGTPQMIRSDGTEKIPGAGLRLSGSTSPSSPETVVPAAFGTIAQYLTYSSEICRKALEPLYGGTTGGMTPGIVSILHPFTGRSTGEDLSTMIVLPGKDLRSAGNYPMMNLAVSMVSLDIMKKAASFRFTTTAGPVATGIPLPGGIYGASPLFTLERVLPLASPAPPSGAPSPTGGANPAVNFQNTFNITVTTTTRGDERELRELGKKIGVILSDELKRYGGLR